MKKYKCIWNYYFARKFSASRFELVMRMFYSSYYAKEFGVKLQNNLVIPQQRNHAIYYVQPEWDRFAGKVYRKVAQSYGVFQRYARLINWTQRRALLITRRIVVRPLARLSWSKLRDCWRSWDQAHFEHFLKPIWIPFIIEPLLARDAEFVLHRIEKRHKTPERFAHDLEIVFSPDKPNAITKERIDLLNLSIRQKMKVKKTTWLTNALRRHEARFAFIPCYDVIDQPWSSKDFRRELQPLLRRSVVSLIAERNELRGKYNKRKRNFHMLLRELKPTAREHALLSMTHELSYIKDEHDDYRRRLSWTIQPLFAELARRARLPFRAPLYLLHDEMEEWFRAGKLPIPRCELLERMRGYLLLREQGGPTIIASGQKMRTLIRSQQFATTGKQANEVRGIIGNPGLVRGVIRIVRTKHDLKWVQPKEIFVAVTTNPDYVPAMRKCSAFVTDEGGLTSHAAIVARELKIPCIIGTKIATKVFKDGDKVEVDAKRGVVRKIISLRRAESRRIGGADKGIVRKI